jgi:hypothetical protein
MAANGNVRVPPDSTGKRVDAASLDDAAVAVYRQKMAVSGVSGTAEVVAVINANAAGTEYGLAVRHVGTALAAVTGTVNLGAGATNIGSINNISATVVAALAAGTNNIGRINDISATVNVAGNVNISATANVVGSLNISGSVVVSGSVNLFTAAVIPSASRGPRCVPVSTSALATLVAAPGAGMAIYVTSLIISNAAGANTKARVGTSASSGQVQAMMAASGGGFVCQYVPPWKLSTNEALVGSVKPNASEGLFNVHFYVASADAA